MTATLATTGPTSVLVEYSLNGGGYWYASATYGADVAADPAMIRDRRAVARDAARAVHHLAAGVGVMTRTTLNY